MQSNQFPLNVRIAADSSPLPVSGRWSDRYGESHQLRRVKDFPSGTRQLKRVRIYSRQEHFVLQWWDPQVKRTLNERVEGDLIDAIARGREIDARLEHFKTSGQGDRRIKHAQLIELYRSDLQRRADAGELAIASVDRYSTALTYYAAFTEQPHVQKSYPFATAVNRDFQLAFAAYLQGLQVLPNGDSSARRRRLGNQRFVLDTVRALFKWAADPSRGNLLPDGFRNPFSGGGRAQQRVEPDQFGEPDVTVTMAVDFLGICDPFQLRLFAPMVLYGLRAAEPALIFREHLDGEWLKIACLPELDYLTKGRRDKRFPFVAPIAELLQPLLADRARGMLYTRRGLMKRERGASLFGMPLSRLEDEFRRRNAANPLNTARLRQQIRDEVVREAGGLTYDHIELEFRKLADQLNWPAQATLKDFRHLFSTCLQNAGMPEYYRRYLMGQSPGKAPIATYTHLNDLQRRFQEATDQEFQPICRAIENRALELELFHS